MEKLKLSVDELSDIVYDENEEFTIVKHETTGHWRHGSEEMIIVKRLSDDKFFEINYRDSVKDSMEFSDMNESGEYNEVFPYEEIVIKYK